MEGEKGIQGELQLHIGGENLYLVTAKIIRSGREESLGALVLAENQDIARLLAKSYWSSESPSFPFDEAHWICSHAPFVANK